MYCAVFRKPIFVSCHTGKSSAPKTAYLYNGHFSQVIHDDSHWHLQKLYRVSVIDIARGLSDFQLTSYLLNEDNVILCYKIPSHPISPLSLSLFLYKKNLVNKNRYMFVVEIRWLGTTPLFSLLNSSFCNDSCSDDANSRCDCDVDTAIQLCSCLPGYHLDATATCQRKWLTAMNKQLVIKLRLVLQHVGIVHV